MPSALSLDAGQVAPDDALPEQTDDCLHDDSDRQTSASDSETMLQELSQQPPSDGLETAR